MNMTGRIARFWMVVVMLDDPVVCGVKLVRDNDQFDPLVIGRVHPAVRDERHAQRVALRDASDSALMLFGLSVPLFFLAAILESFVRESMLGTAARLGIAALMFVLLASGAALLRVLARSKSADSSWLSELRHNDA